MGVREQVPVSDSIVHVKFSLSDPSYPMVGASELSGGRMTLEEIIPRGEGKYAEFFSLTGAPPDRILDLAEAHEGIDATLLAEYDEGGLFEFEVSENCPAVFLGEEGALPRQAEGIDGKGYISCEIAPENDAKRIIDRFLDAHPTAELEHKRSQPYVTPMFSHRQLQDAVNAALTRRQREALAVAHEAGYYDWPRETTGESIADELGISPSTFHEHIRAAERKLINLLFDPETEEAAARSRPYRS